MSKKDDGTPQGRVAGYETGPDGVRFWRDPGNGQFAKPGWSTAKGLALNLVGLLEDLAKDRGDAGLMVHPKGDALKSLGAGPGDAVRARYLDSTHAMVEIVRDGKLIQRKVAWTSLDRPSDNPDTGVQGTQAAEFAQRLVDTPSAAVTPTQIEFQGDSYSVYPDGRVTNADGTAASDYMAGVVREELRRRDTYGSDRYGPPPTTAQEARDAGYTEGPYWHATSPIAAEKILSDGFLAPGAEDWELDNDGTIEEWDKDGSTRPVYFGNTPEEVAGYGETAVPLMIRPGSKRPGTGFVEAFMVDPADAVPLTDVDAPFSAIPDAKKVARELNDRMESVVVGSSYPAIENLIDLADPVPGPLYKGSDNHTFDQMVADGTVTFKTPVSVSSELTGAEMFVDTEPRPLSNEEYLRWANGELPVRRDGYDTTTKPIMFEIMGAKAIDATATIESLYSTGDWDIRTDMFETSTTSTDLNEDLGWKAASQTSEWIAAAGDYRVVSVNEHDGYRYVRIEAVAAQPEPDAPTLPEGGELSPELAAVVALLDGTSTDFDNEDELVMDLGMALFTKDFGDGAYQAEFENGMISLHDESAKFDGIIYDNETFTNLGTFSRALSIDDETGVVEMYHDVFRINPDAQGKGIGSMFTAAQLDAYRQAGIDRVRTTAASGTSYDDDGVEYPGMRMNGAYTWAAAGFDWDPEVGYQDANNIGRKILRLDPESKLGAALVAWRGGEPDDTVPIPFDVAADPVGKRVLLGDMGGDQLEPMTWMAVLPLTERGGAAVRQPVTDAGRAKRDGVPLTAPETPAPAVPDVAAPDVAEPLSTVRDRIRQESLFAEDFGFTGTAAPTLFDPDAPPVERGPLVVGDLDGLGDALDRIEITANGDRFAANLDAEDVATVKRYAAQLFAHRGDYANSTVESVRPTALADGTPAFIVDGLITSESGFPIGSWQRQIAADRSVQPPVWAVRGTDLRMGEDNRGLGYGMWFVAESETALRDAGFDHVITDAVSDPARDLNGAYTMATAGYDWDTSPEGVDLVRTLGDALLGEDEDSWLGEALAGWDGTITEDFPTPLDIALDPDGFELLRHGQASWIGRRSLQDPNRTDLPPLDDPAWLGTRADTSVPELLSESAPFRAFSPGVQAALENVASQWYDHDLGDGYTSEVVGVSFARNSAGGLPVTVMGVIRDGDGNRVGEFTRALHRVNVDDLMEPVAEGDDIVINHEYLSIGVDHQGKGLGSRFMAASLDAYQGHGIDVVTTNAMSDPEENLNGAYTWAVAGFDWDPASWSLAQEIGAHMLDADPDSVVGRMLVDDYNPDTSPTPLDVAMDPVGKLVLKGEPGVVSWNGVLPVNPGAARREPVTPAGRDRAGLTPPRPVPVSAADVGEFLAYTFANPDNPPTEAETRDAMALLYEHTLPNGYRTTVTEAKIRPGQFTGINVDGAIYESDGTLVGHFSRTIGESSDGLTARHESISLKEYHQGKGVGAQLTASVFDAYRDAGIAKVKTDAASTGTDAMNGAYTWAVAGFDWDPDDSKTLDKMHDIGNRMLRSDPDSALGQALVDTTGDNLADSPTPLDIALDPTGGNVLKGGAGNLVWPGVYYPSGDQREPITNPARERLGLDLIIPPTPAVPNTDDTADGTVPFDPNEPIPLTPRVGSRLMELGHSGYDNEEANAEATAIAKALFDHDLGDGYSTRIVTASSRSTVEQQGIVAADGEILGPDGTRVGTFSRQFRPMLFGTNGDGADRVPEVVWETPPQVSPIEGMELGETKSFAAADLPATLMPGAVISMTSASGSTLTGSVTDNGQIRFNDSPSLGMAWASTLGEFATEVPGRNRLRDAWSADGTVTITLPDSIPDEKRTVWNVTPDPDVGLGVVNDTLKIDLAHQGKGVGSRFVAASENGYAQIGVDQAIVHAVTRNYPTDPEDARYNGAYTWAKGGGYDFVAKGDFVDGVDMVRTLGRRMIQLDETSQMGALLSEWNGRDRDNIPTPLEVALDPTGAAALKDSEYSQWWGAKPLSDRFKAMQRAQREQSLTAPAELPAPKITNDDTTVGGDVPFDLDQPIPLTSRVKARLAHLSEHGTDGKASNHPELLAIARAVFNQDDIGGGIRASVTGVYNLNGEGGTLDVNGILVNSSGRQIGFFDRRFRPMSAGDLNAVDVETVMVETPQPQVSPLPGVGLGETTRHSLIDLPENLPEGTVLTWTKTGGPHSPTMQYRAVRRPWGSYDVEATGPTGDVSPMPSMKLEDFRLDAARLSDDSTADLTLPDVIPPVVSAQHTVTPRPNAGYGVQNYSIEIADEFQRQGIGSRFIAASEESYAKVGFDQTVVHAVGDGSRFNGAYTWAKACVPMRARMLTQRGWLSWHEIDAATDLAAQWDNGDLRWLPIVSVDRYGSRETITFGKHGWSFTATGNHRVLASVGVESGQSRSPRSPRLARLDELMPKFGTYSRASILTAAPLVAGDRSGLSPDQAALLGWLITDGSVVIRQRGVSGQHVEVAATITQSKELGRKEISALLERMGGWSGRWMDGPTRSAVNVPTRHVRELHSVVGVPAIVGVGATDRLKAGLSDVVLRMGHEQLAAFVRAAELAEGASGFLGDDAEHPGNRRRMWQNPGACNDALRLAFFLAGNRIGKSVPRRGSTNESWAVSAATIPTQSLAVTGRTTEETWCPHTTTGTWVCELDGIMSITGNSGYDWMHDPSGFGQAMLERDPNSEIGKRLAEFDGGEDWSGVPTPLEVALDPIGKELLLNGNVEWWGTKPLSDEFKAIAAARRQPTPGAPDTPVAPTTAPEDLPINFGRWSVGEMVDADDINLLPEGTDFSAGFDSYTALGGDTFDNDGTTITGERLRRQLDGDQVYIDSLPGNSGPPAPTPDPVPDAPEPAVDTPDAPATVGERRLPGWYLARMGNDITVEGANGTRATGQISTVSQDTRRGDTVTISTADGPRSFPVNTTIVVGSTGVEPWADGGMVARYRNRDYRIDSDGNVTKADDYNASIAKSTATGVKNAAIADATERFTDATPEPAPAPTPAPDPVPDVPNMPEPAPEVPEPVAPGTPEVPTLPTGGRDFAVARPEHVLNVGYSDGAIIEQLKQLPKGAGRQYTVTDAAGNRFRMVGKDERGLRYQMLAANDDTVVGEWIMLPAEAPFTISDVVPGTYDETFAGSDAAITRLGDEMLAKNPDLAPIVWSDISPAAWLDMSTEEQAQNGMPDAEQGQALRSAITRFLGEAQRAVVRVGDTSLSEREYLPYRFYKVESATVPTREYGAETTGAAKVLWTTEPPTPDAPAFKLTRAQLDSALDSDEPGRPDFVWTGQVRAPEWDAPVPDNPRTEEQRSAAVQKLATNIFPVDIPIWEADRLEEALPMGPKGMLIDALTRGGYATPTDPAFQSLRVPVNGVVIRQDGSVQWSLSAPGEGDLSAPRLYDGDVTYSIDDPLLPQAVAAATQRNQATQLSQILNGRQQRSGRGRTLGTPAGDYARWVDTQSKQILDESFTDTTDLAYDQETGAFTRSATPTEYHVNSEQLRRAFADRDEQGNPRLWLNADDRAGVVGIETDYSKVRDKSLPFDDRVAALAEQRTALQRLLPGDGPQTWFSGLATSATITDVIDGTADEQTQRNMQRVAMLQEFGMELHALVSEQFAASKVAAHSVDQADTDKAMAALSTGVFERELRSDVARGEHPVLGRLVAQMDGDPDMADDPFVLEDVKADSDDPTDGYTMTLRRLASRNAVLVKVGRAAIGGPLVTWIAKENQGARAEQIGPVTLHTDGHMADLAQFGDTLRSLNHVTKEADALAEVTAANRGGRRVVKANPFPPEATRDAMAAMLENTPVDRFAFYKFTHDASSGEYQIDGDAAHLSAVTAGTKDGRKNVKLTFVTMLGSYYERKFTVTINDDNSMTLNKNGSRRAVGRAPANVDSNTYASMAAVVADLKKQAPKADKKDDKPTVDAATVAESTPLKAFHAVMEKMGVDMSTDESLQIGRGGEGPLKPIGEATAGLAETARAGLAVFPRAWTTVLAKNRPIRLQLRRGNVDFRSEGGYNAQPGTRVNPSGPHDLISTPDITLRPDYADVAGHEFGHSFQHVIPGLEKAEQWYLVSRVAASPPEKQKPRVYGTGRRGRTDYVFEDEFARSYTGRTYGSGVSEAREVFTTAVQGMYNDIGGQSGFGADTRLQAWAIAMMALHDPGVGTNTDRAAMTGAQLLGASYSKKDVESLLKSSELTVAQRNELKDILASM